MKQKIGVFMICSIGLIALGLSVWSIAKPYGIAMLPSERGATIIIVVTAILQMIFCVLSVCAYCQNKKKWIVRNQKLTIGVTLLSILLLLLILQDVVLVRLSTVLGLASLQLYNFNWFSSAILKGERKC